MIRLWWVAVDEEVLARQLAEKQQLENDIELLNEIIDLSLKLSTPHEVINNAYNALCATCFHLICSRHISDFVRYLLVGRFRVLVLVEIFIKVRGHYCLLFSSLS